MLDLMIARATEGLDAGESRELDRALAGSPELDMEGLELAAAATALAFEAHAADTEPMPEMVKARILAQAPGRKSGQPKVSVFDTRYLGWYAAAAALLLAFWAPWSTGPQSPAPLPGMAEQRSSLIAGASDVIQVAWATPEIPEYAQVTGDVVWSNANQSGFMRLRGLPANRSTVEQYQLWIVDPSRDDKPIDGGVFDIPAGVDEVLVPIDAKLQVDDPQVFAITLEKPGGVVVSDGPLLVVAPV
jgi:hypothetical protein